MVAGRETGISIALEAPQRERAFLTAHGVLTDYGIGDIPARGAIAADLVLLTGYFSLPGLRGDGTRQLLRRARQRRRTVRSSTPAGTPRTGAVRQPRRSCDLLPLVDLFLPNEPEALVLTGARPLRRPSSSSPNDAAAGSS